MHVSSVATWNTGWGENSVAAGDAEAVRRADDAVGGAAGEGTGGRRKRREAGRQAGGAGQTTGGREQKMRRRGQEIQRQGQQIQRQGQQIQRLGQHTHSQGQKSTDISRRIRSRRTRTTYTDRSCR